MIVNVLIVIGIIGVLCYFLFDSYMWKKINIESILRKELKKRNGNLLSIERTGRFDTGPFPKFEIKAATSEEPAIIIPGIPVGNKTLYKKVLWTDIRNVKKTSWAEMVFVPFYRLSKIEWKDETDST